MTKPQDQAVVDRKDFRLGGIKVNIVYEAAFNDKADFYY
jgi:hypothetical protein